MTTIGGLVQDASRAGTYHRISAKLSSHDMPRVVDEVVTSTVKPRAAAAVSRSLPFAIYIAFLAASPTLGPLLGDPRWLYAIQIGSVLGLLCFFARDYVELKCISSIRPADW